MELAPPTNTMIIKYIDNKISKWSVEINELVWANRTPANPAKIPEIKKASILYLDKLIPAASAACSESRMAMKARPIFDLAIRRPTITAIITNV